MFAAMIGFCAASASAQQDQKAETSQPAPAAAPQQAAPPAQPAPAAPSTQTAAPTPEAAPTPTPAPAPAPAPAPTPAPTPTPAPAAQPPAPVAPPPPPAKPKQVLYGDPCRADLEKFCTGNQPQAIKMRCLDSHEPEFSGACQKRRGELRELKAACQTVIEQNCRYVPLFADAILNCLADHAEAVLDKCKSLREKALEPSHYVAKACQADVKKLCKDVPVNGFKIAQCLQEHEAELAKPCLEGAPEK
jgi:hypothetical protein